jgi:dsDNA-specific endonuclease/ATPase MutS2
MLRPQTIRILRSTTFALVTTVGLGTAGISAAAASPEDEIARLNRVRTNLFEELVKTRAEAATARAERDEALKVRDAAEAELTRLKQEAANAKPASPVLRAEAKARPQQRAAAAASPAARRQSARPAAAAGSVLKTSTARAQQQIVRASPSPHPAIRQSEPVPRHGAPAARSQELPSVLRLQDPQ